MEAIGGRRTVLELLRSGRIVTKIHMAKGLKPNEAMRAVIEAAEAKNIPVQWVDRRRIDEEAGGGVHQGIVAFVEEFKFRDLSEVLERLGERKSAVMVALDGVTDPHNVGALIRTADCAGVDALILPKRRSASVTATVHKASAGAVEYVPIVQVGNLASAIDRIKEAGFWSYGADASSEVALFGFDFPGKVLLVLGSEGAGLSRLIREKCDGLISIPMKGRVASLNVSVAGALMMYEIARSRMSG
ncbi:MAG: 23S rRNA (guanosine(2251)-2'-O)-methyltransferase RlmB [Candidatus Aquicultorales bacterium]